MCRNVQTTLGINLRPGPIRPWTQPNFPTAPQTKNGNNFLLLTSQKINTLLIFFLPLTQLSDTTFWPRHDYRVRSKERRDRVVSCRHAVLYSPREQDSKGFHNEGQLFDI